MYGLKPKHYVIERGGLEMLVKQLEGEVLIVSHRDGVLYLEGLFNIPLTVKARSVPAEIPPSMCQANPTPFEGGVAFTLRVSPEASPSVCGNLFHMHVGPGSIRKYLFIVYAMNKNVAAMFTCGAAESNFRILRNAIDWPW